MSTEVEVYERPAANELEQWARDLTTAYQAARQLVTTSFVPRTYQGKPEEAAAAIMTGKEVGLSPLAALRSIDIIGGVPAMRAIALRALVQSSGHEIWTEESTATQAIVAGRRKGSDKVERSVWTMDRARELKLATKDNWKNQPIAMLLARATSELVRLIAADVILGIPYSIEEIADLQGAEAPVQPEAPRQSSGRSVRRKPIAKPAEVEDVEDEPSESEEANAEADAAIAQNEAELAEIEREHRKSVAEGLRDAAVKARGKADRMPRDVVKAFEGDPSKPTAEELAEWGALPMDGES